MFWWIDDLLRHHDLTVLIKVAFFNSCCGSHAFYYDAPQQFWPSLIDTPNGGGRRGIIHFRIVYCWNFVVLHLLATINRERFSYFKSDTMATKSPICSHQNRNIHTWYMTFLSKFISWQNNSLFIADLTNTHLCYQWREFRQDYADTELCTENTTLIHHHATNNINCTLF